MSKLRLSRELFSINSIDKTKQIFESLANITIEVVNGYHEIEFSNCNHELEKTKAEFENYVIGLMNVRKSYDEDN